MLRNRILSLVGLLMLAVVSVNGQILKGLEKYQYSYTQTDQLDPVVAEATMASFGLIIDTDKYVSKMTSLETAVCIEEKDVKNFIKTAQKIIKKEKVTLIQTVKNEAMTMELYAKDGEIIALSNIDNEVATIYVIK